MEEDKNYIIYFIIYVIIFLLIVSNIGALTMFVANYKEGKEIDRKIDENLENMFNSIYDELEGQMERLLNKMLEKMRNLKKEDTYSKLGMEQELKSLTDKFIYQLKQEENPMKSWTQNMELMIIDAVYQKLSDMEKVLSMELTAQTVLIKNLDQNMAQQLNAFEYNVTNELNYTANIIVHNEIQMEKIHKMASENMNNISSSINIQINDINNKLQLKLMEAVAQLNNSVYSEIKYLYEHLTDKVNERLTHDNALVNTLYHMINGYIRSMNETLYNEMVQGSITDDAMLNVYRNKINKMIQEAKIKASNATSVMEYRMDEEIVVKQQRLASLIEEMAQNETHINTMKVIQNLLSLFRSTTQQRNTLMQFMVNIIQNMGQTSISDLGYFDNENNYATYTYLASNTISLLNDLANDITTAFNNENEVMSMTYNVNVEISNIIDQ